MCLCLLDSSGLSLMEPMFLQLGCTLGCGEGALADASAPEAASAQWPSAQSSGFAKLTC